MSNNQIAIDGYVIHRKDRAVTKNKNDVELLLYCRNSLTCSRRSDLEISNLETTVYGQKLNCQMQDHSLCAQPTTLPMLLVNEVTFLMKSPL